MRAAVINTTSNIVENLILVNQLSDWSAPSGYEAVDVTSVDCAIGDSYDGTNFTHPTPPTPPTPTAQQQIDALMGQLTLLDPFLTRATEDHWAATSFDVTTLPAVTQDRLTQKQSIRSQIAALRS